MSNQEKAPGYAWLSLALAALGILSMIVAFLIAVRPGASAEAPAAPMTWSFLDGIDDVTLSGCQVVAGLDGLAERSEAVIEIRNGTALTQTYTVHVSVEDQTGTRVGEIVAISNALAPGQHAVLSGLDATGPVPPSTPVGPVQCTVAAVERFPLV